MTAQSKATLKAYFETGDYPTEAQFADLIDSFDDYGSAASRKVLTDYANVVVVDAGGNGDYTTQAAAAAAITDDDASHVYNVFVFGEAVGAVWDRRPYIRVHGQAYYAPLPASNLALWLDASQITGLSDGDRVASWIDASGNSRSASQGDVNFRPLYKTGILNGLPVVRFDGIDDYLVTPPFLGEQYNKAFTVYAIAPTAQGVSQKIFISNQLAAFFISGQTINLRVNSQMDFKMTGLNNNDNYWQHPYGYLDAAYWVDPKQIIGITYNGTAQTLMVNGVAKTYPATGNLGLSGAFTIGARSTPDLYWKGDVAEILIYNTSHSAKQMLQVQQYLAKKYGLALKQRNYTLIGDSHTAGSYSESTRGYPGALLDITADSDSVIVYNNGYQGRTLATMMTLEPYYIESYLSDYKQNIAVVWGGVNDVAGGGVDAAELWSRLSHICAAMKAAGFYTIVCTEIDAQDAARNAVDWHGTIWPAYNTLIRNNYASFADALADLGANAALQNANNTTYYTEDKIHLHDAANMVVAKIIKDVIDQHI